MGNPGNVCHELVTDGRDGGSWRDHGGSREHPQITRRPPTRNLMAAPSPVHSAQPALSYVVLEREARRGGGSGGRVMVAVESLAAKKASQPPDLAAERRCGAQQRGDQPYLRREVRVHRSLDEVTRGLFKYLQPDNPEYELEYRRH